MATQIQTEHFVKSLYSLLDETFDNVHGFYLEKGTALFETLASITSAEASVPVGGKCATLAAHVKHVAFYLHVVDKSVRDQNFPRVDWEEIWQTVSRVTPDEWKSIKIELRENYSRIKKLIGDIPEWSSEQHIGDAVAVIAHTAYHLGAIRQALCSLRP